ncbi:DUF5591 domain-containing protein [Kordiimonas gwangyangensis]|uniref:DUF5591 domain-containing protein n=1 Tax=Kordiimonas gwangyangensis TaxID=288022 RepID=UPI000365171B|nr:DUF5591 domain-containing protein [Kordiimonas gwangyangensis]
MSAFNRVDYRELRRDWYANGDLMSRFIRRAVQGMKENTDNFQFINFPKTWVALFEYFGLDWKNSTDVNTYVPFISGLTEETLIYEIEAAKRNGQLRLLLEAVASVDVTISETLQRIDEASLGPINPISEVRTSYDEPIILSNWHSYLRPDIRRFEAEVPTLEQQNKKILLLPCGKKRPYHQSPTYKNLTGRLFEAGYDLEDYDQVVVTSLGFIPKETWEHSIVMRYDTGVRDLYRMLVMGRRLLKNCFYEEALDCLSFRPYRDLVSILGMEGHFKKIQRPNGLRVRTIPVYR